jgi:putative ABC transport system ATP-binding protein
VVSSSASPSPAPSYFAHLDSANGQHILDLLLHLNHVEGTTLVLVTHDPVLATYASRRITLRDGLVVADEVQTPAAVSA